MGKYDQKKSASPFSASRVSRGSGSVSDNPELEEVSKWLASVQFRKKAMGGLDPADVWKKLEELNALYENAIVAERVRHQLLLRQIRQQMMPLHPEEPNG